MTHFIDIHAHLDHALFKNDLDKVIERAKKADVKTIVTNGINPETNRISLELAKKYDVVKAALGIYPIEALKVEIKAGEYPLKPNVFDIDEEIDFIKKQKDNIVAIGECGLDYKNADDKVQQKQVFQKLIKIAEKTKLPIIIHSRKAEQDVIDILESSNAKKVILHCFCGKKRLVKIAADLGLSFSIPTNVIRSQQFQDIVKEVSINQLFTETDAPYLSPFKDKKNEPSFVLESYKQIAKIKGFESEEVKNNIYLNYMKMF